MTCVSLLPLLAFGLGGCDRGLDVFFVDSGVRDLGAPDLRRDLAMRDLATRDLATRDLAMRDLAQPDLERRDLAQPDLTVRDLSTPDLARPDLSMPDLVVPDLSMPDLARPDLSMPDLVVPDLSVPDLGMPDLSVPDLARPDLSTPDLATRDLLPPSDLAAAPDLARDMAGGCVPYLALPSVPAVPVDAATNQVVPADVDVDGNLDAVLLGGGQVTVVLGRGNGIFVPSGSPTPAASAFGIAVGDVDGDKRPDVVMRASLTTVEVRRGDGLGSFGAPVAYTVTRPLMPHLVDADLDGDLDLFVINSDMGFELLLNQGGVFGPSRSSPSSLPSPTPSGWPPSATSTATVAPTW